MNSIERKRSLKAYLSNKEGQFVNIINRYNLKIRENGKLVKSDILAYHNQTGMIKRLKGYTLTILLNDEKSLSIGLRNIESAYIIRRPDSLRIRYKLYYK